MDDVQSDKVTFKDFNPNIIILTDNKNDDLDLFEEHQIITLQTIQEFVDALVLTTTTTTTTMENDNDVTSTIEDTMQQIVLERNPIIAQQMQYWGISLLHLLVYFPGQKNEGGEDHDDDDDNTYQVLSSLLTKYPKAATQMDMDGRIPIHHAIARLNHSSCDKMSQKCFDLLLKHSPDSVVHSFINVLPGLDWYHHLRPIVLAKIHILTMKDEESGLLPFMKAAEGHGETNEFQLDVVYELLTLRPDVDNVRLKG